MVKKINLNKYQKIIGILLFLIYLGTCFLTVDDYGFTWDIIYEDISGQTIIQYYKNPSIDNKNSLMVSVQNHFYMPPKTASILIAGSSSIFAENKEISKRMTTSIPIVILSSLTLLLIYFFMLKEVGFKAAFFSSISFMLYPRLFEHVHNNMKDPIAMMVTVLFLFAFFRYFRTRKLIYAIFTSSAAAFLLHTKIYTIFAFLVVLAWIVWNWKETKYFLKSKKTLYHLIIGIVLFLGIINLLAPVYWKKLLFLNMFKIKSILFKKTLYLGKFYFESLPNNYSIIMILITTPLIILFGLIYGLIYIIKELKDSNKKKTFYTLLILGFFIPLIRYPLFDIPVYDGIRQLMDSLPFMFMITGIGLTAAYDKIHKLLVLENNNNNNNLTNWLIIILFFLLFTIPLIMILQLHPHQIAYYNPLVGGVEGAKGNFELDYWGSSYKQGTEWINNHLPPGSTVMVPIAWHLPRYYLDENINLVPGNQLESLKKKDVFYIMTIDRGYYFSDNDKWVNWLNKGSIIYQIKAKNTPILDIYKINKTISV